MGLIRMGTAQRSRKGVGDKLNITYASSSHGYCHAFCLRKKARQVFAYAQTAMQLMRMLNFNLEEWDWINHTYPD